MLQWGLISSLFRTSTQSFPDEGLTFYAEHIMSVEVRWMNSLFGFQNDVRKILYPHRIMHTISNYLLIPDVMHSNRSGGTRMKPSVLAFSNFFNRAR